MSDLRIVLPVSDEEFESWLEAMRSVDKHSRRRRREWGPDQRIKVIVKAGELK